jgi:hypothetical protein
MSLRATRLADERHTNEELIAKLRYMNTETEKFVVEQRKLIVDSQKLNWERAVVSMLQILTVIASSAAVATMVAALIAKLVH